MAMTIASIGLSIYQGVEQQKAGRAAEREAKEAAAEERRQAVSEASMGVEKAHDILVESRYEQGALKALGAAAGVGGTSFNTMMNKIEGRKRRKMFLQQKETSESMRRHEVGARAYEKQGKRIRKAYDYSAYFSYAQAGMKLYSAGSQGMPMLGGGSSYSQPLYRSH